MDVLRLRRRWHLKSLGEPSYGSESKITIDPATKMAEDQSKYGFTEAQRKWTIHGHPLKDGDIYNGRQFFSSTDIIQEFIDTRDNDTYIVQFLVHPHQQVDKETGETVIHNRVRTLVFPGRDVVVMHYEKEATQLLTRIVLPSKTDKSKYGWRLIQ